MGVLGGFTGFLGFLMGSYSFSGSRGYGGVYLGLLEFLGVQFDSGGLTGIQKGLRAILWVRWYP